MDKHTNECVDGLIDKQKEKESDKYLLYSLNWNPKLTANASQNWSKTNNWWKIEFIGSNFSKMLKSLKVAKKKKTFSFVFVQNYRMMTKKSFVSSKSSSYFWYSVDPV